MKKIEEKKQEEKGKLLKGYVKLIILFTAVVALVFVLRNWYINSKDFEMGIPVINETLKQELKSTEIYNYIRENENAVIYVGVADSKKCRDFETIFNGIIKDRSLENTITYLNLSTESNKKSFIKEFNKFYNTSLKSYPSVIVFNEGQVVSIFDADNTSKEKIMNFIDMNNIISKDY